MPERRKWVAAWNASDQTQEEFARAHGLKVGTLRNWNDPPHGPDRTVKTPVRRIQFRGVQA